MKFILLDKNNYISSDTVTDRKESWRNFLQLSLERKVGHFISFYYSLTLSVLHSPLPTARSLEQMLPLKLSMSSHWQEENRAVVDYKKQNISESYQTSQVWEEIGLFSVCVSKLSLGNVFHWQRETSGLIWATFELNIYDSERMSTTQLLRVLKERLRVAELWDEFIQNQERKVVPLVEGDSHGWDGVHAHHALGMVVAEPEGWEPGEYVCSLERGILCWTSSSAHLPKYQEWCNQTGQDKLVLCVHDQLLLINGLNKAAKLFPLVMLYDSNLLKLETPETCLHSSTRIFPITLKGQFLQHHFRKCLCCTDSCSRKSAS